jgi:Vault protein inter-alpha-trypsin domain
LEEADTSAEVVVAEEHGLSELLSEEQVSTEHQPVASSVPPTPDPTHPLLLPYAADIAASPHIAPLSPYLSPGSGNFRSYQQPLQQIAPCSFRTTVNDEEAIRGVLREKQSAKDEYNWAVVTGKTAYLLEQEATDGKCLECVIANTRKMTT